jgi:hypothetical protein
MTLLKVWYQPVASLATGRGHLSLVEPAEEWFGA